MTPILSMKKSWIQMSIQVISHRSRKSHQNQAVTLGVLLLTNIHTTSAPYHSEPTSTRAALCPTQTQPESAGTPARNSFFKPHTKKAACQAQTWSGGTVSEVGFECLVFCFGPELPNRHASLFPFYSLIFITKLAVNSWTDGESA